ncbi:MAG TPA: type VI secretion system baseplate subunit TssE [Quisquiliibacterium sp.]|nr:MAG: type VI secretion system baseplate subunit TssE [Burkholderiaceae bacterium]HOA93012.1 type VI secretion system baseplate subunit TssE [Quisquiliibacterium sp.]HPA89672.1 type VI secretion system baseplate subunit TssE [Quisquiliibacterium sp.]HQD82466.1 type VI secretion system baseplate subunit TssE [Quisquiliibacterium sp.]HQN13054.1 type VI secretion system baseplate subunit TssE [Quisquiliibacterium sp.]
MSEVFSRDRLQPALLDRLIDHEPGVQVEPIDARTITRSRLRQSVLRDLSWLLNAQAGLDDEVDPRAFAAALRSTVNYGMPALSGRLVSQVQISDLEAAIREAVLAFEPRILPHTLRVEGVLPDGAHHNLLSFEITAQLWAQPYPLELLLKTDLDLETGLVELRDRAGGAGPAVLSPLTPSADDPPQD